MLLNTFCPKFWFEKAAAKVPPGRAEILRSGIQEIAVRLEIAVRVSPRPTHGGGEAQDGIGVAVDPADAGRRQVLTHVQLDGGFPVSKQVVDHGPPRGDVVIAFHAVLSGEHDRDRNEPRGSHLLIEEVAVGMVVPHSALQRQPAARPLFLRIQGGCGYTRVAPEGASEHRQLVGDAVVDTIGERGAVNRIESSLPK